MGKSTYKKLYMNRSTPMKDKKIIYSILITTAFLLAVGLTYVYFSGGIAGTRKNNRKIVYCNKYSRL